MRGERRRLPVGPALRIHFSFVSRPFAVINNGHGSQLATISSMISESTPVSLHSVS